MWVENIYPRYDHSGHYNIVSIELYVWISVN